MFVPQMAPIMWLPMILSITTFLMFLKAMLFFYSVEMKYNSKLKFMPKKLYWVW